MTWLGSLDQHSQDSVPVPFQLSYLSSMHLPIPLTFIEHGVLSQPCYFFLDSSLWHFGKAQV